MLISETIYTSPDLSEFIGEIVRFYSGDVKAIKVEIGWDDEGLDGYYDEDDPKDIPVIRFRVFVDEYACDQMGYIPDYTVEDIENGITFAALPDGSYATRINAGSSVSVLRSLLTHIIESAEDSIIEGSYKRKLEELSWVDDSDLK